MTAPKLFLTGLPGSGKSTVMLKCVEGLRGLGFEVGGITTPEIRIGGTRAGFSVVDLASGRMASMAGVNTISRFRVGRYGVDLEAFESVALPAICNAERSGDVVCVDEIGHMELFSDAFRKKAELLIRGPKPMIAVLHRNYVGEYGGWGRLFIVAPDTREHLPDEVVSILVDYLRKDI